MPRARVKRCSKCLRVKALAAFSRDASKRGGRRSHCKPCMATYHASPERRAAERARHATPEYRADNCARMARLRSTPEYRAAEREYDRSPERLSAKRARRRASGYADNHARRARLRDAVCDLHGRACATAAVLRELREDCNDACTYCDAPADTWEHVDPLGTGGRNCGYWRMVRACRSCNGRRQHRDQRAFLAERVADEHNPLPARVLELYDAAVSAYLEAEAALSA